MEVGEGREEVRIGRVGTRLMAVVRAEERRVVVGIALLSREASKPGGGSMDALVYGPSSDVSFSNTVISRVLPFVPPSRRYLPGRWIVAQS